MYSASDISRMIKASKMRWAIHVLSVKEMRNAHKVLVGKPEGKRPFGRREHRGQDNTKNNLIEVGRESVDWIRVTRNRDQRWTREQCSEPQGDIGWLNNCWVLKIDSSPCSQFGMYSYVTDLMEE
jgi:hypothetical protein